MLGSPPGTHQPQLVEAGVIPGAPKIDDAGPPGELLRRRPDLIVAERRLAASNARIGIAIAEYYPKLSLSGLIGSATSVSSGNLFTRGASQAAGVLGLRWRLFDFGRINAQIHQAKRQEAEMLAAYRLAVLRATEDVEKPPWSSARSRLPCSPSLVDRCFDAGAIVTMKGSPADHWIGVVSGMVKVDTMEVNGRTTTFIGVSKGGWLGEGSVLKDEPRPYEIVALQESRIAFMPRSTFHWLYENSLPFNHFLIAQLNARLGQFISLVEKTRMAETPAQVAFGLASLLNPLLNPAADCKVRISQEELGKLCGLSRQIVSGALRRLQRAGVVSLEYGGVRVLDVPALNRFAGVVYQ